MTATFDDLNTDCLVNILSFLTREQMDDITLLSQRLAEARNHATLNQTRTANIVNKSTSLLEVFETIARQGWAASVFHPNSNKKCLNLIGLERLQDQRGWMSREVARAEQNDIHLQSVTRLVSVSRSASPNGQNPSKLPPYAIDNIMCILPNLQILDLRNLDGVADIDMLCRHCPNLTHFKWIGCGYIILPVASQANLTEICLDDCRISTHDEDEEFSTHMADAQNYLFMQCPRLERLSIKNVTYTMYYRHKPSLKQNHLIKLIRFHPTLKWLKSDLTDENIAMLRREKPEVMLIND